MVKPSISIQSWSDPRAYTKDAHLYTTQFDHSLAILVFEQTHRFHWHQNLMPHNTKTCGK
ncbi:hypothetical protein SADUNF_Sadunf02G0022100 [Salix dunnii]|uniref:Uncharacterized protein n=1 Tax=Salix dunnii TaxID=1413687 RepID=A0A835N5L6_9ROSI|nr:hypothetical protein SADUNF_Sadunf02G0022100 [Salix dunnii]